MPIVWINSSLTIKSPRNAWSLIKFTSEPGYTKSKAFASRNSGAFSWMTGESSLWYLVLKTRTVGDIESAI